jgi:hypothetical protein
MKAAILAARLSPPGEELLFNSFGAEYLGVCSELLRLDWLHTNKVEGNLRSVFGVAL